MLVFSTGVSAKWSTWLRILATSRPRGKVLSILKYYSRRVDRTIEDNQVQNRADIRNYVEGRILHEMVAKAGQAQQTAMDAMDVMRVAGWSNVSLLRGFVDAICAKSDDMFLYAKMVLDGIDESGRLPASVDKLNQGGLPRGPGRLLR